MEIKFFLSDNEMAPTTISGKLFANALKEAGYPVEIIQNKEDKKRLLKTGDSDAIFFQKCFYEGHRYEDVRHLKGKVFLIYIDDDFMEMNDRGHLDVLKIADLIIVGNRAHAERLKEYTSTPCEAVYTLADYKNYPYTPFEKRNNNPMIIYWEKNLADVYIDDLLMIKEPLDMIHKKYGAAVRLYGWHKGKHYGLADKSPIIKKAFPYAECIPFQVPEIYVKELVPEIAKSDICIAPCIDIPDRYGKSGFGLKHTMLLGVPVIASNLGIYQELIQDGENGFLASTGEEWYEKLEIMILQPTLRKEFSMNARHVMETKYDYDTCVGVFVNAVKKHVLL